jgi:hypothetical protein
MALECSTRSSIAPRRARCEGGFWNAELVATLEAVAGRAEEYDVKGALFQDSLDEYPMPSALNPTEKLRHDVPPRELRRFVRVALPGMRLTTGLAHPRCR